MCSAVFVCQQTSIPDSESILDQNCLSRCSTELFSEASWEQVDKQDTEVQAQPLQSSSTPIPAPCPWPRKKLTAVSLEPLAPQLLGAHVRSVISEPGRLSERASLSIASVKWSSASFHSNPGCCCGHFCLRGAWSPLQGNDLDAFLVLLTADLLGWHHWSQGGPSDSYCLQHGSVAPAGCPTSLSLTWSNLFCR